MQKTFEFVREGQQRVADVRRALVRARAQLTEVELQVWREGTPTGCVLECNGEGFFCETGANWLRLGTRGALIAPHCLRLC